MSKKISRRKREIESKDLTEMLEGDFEELVVERQLKVINAIQNLYGIVLGMSKETLEEPVYFHEDKHMTFLQCIYVVGSEILHNISRGIPYCVNNVTDIVKRLERDYDIPLAARVVFDRLHSEHQNIRIDCGNCNLNGRE